MKSVRFKHMWEGFDLGRNPLLDLIRSVSVEPVTVVVDPSRYVDLEIGSVYPNRRWLIESYGRAALGRARRNPTDVRASFATPLPSPSARSSLWYTPENRRPPADGWDYTLSYEADTWPRNAYLPFWVLNSDLYGTGDPSFLGESLSIQKMTSSRSAATSERNGFCCAVIRNPDSARLSAIRQLRRIGPVDVYGPYANRPIPSKRDVLSQYRFALCFENSLYPGYVTEKIFDAWSSGCIPIYWGLDREGTLNPDAALNLATIPGGFPELIDSVADLNGQTEALDEMAGKPVLRATPTTSAVRDLIQSALGE